MNWPYKHRWEFGAFAGGWAAYSCRICGRFGIGGCLWQRLFNPCIPDEKTIEYWEKPDHSKENV